MFDKLQFFWVSFFSDFQLFEIVDFPVRKLLRVIDQLKQA